MTDGEIWVQVYKAGKGWSLDLSHVFAIPQPEFLVLCGVYFQAFPHLPDQAVLLVILLLMTHETDLKYTWGNSLTTSLGAAMTFNLSLLLGFCLDALDPLVKSI